MDKQRLNLKRLFATILFSAALIVGTDSVRRSFSDGATGEIVVKGNFKDSVTNEWSKQTNDTEADISRNDTIEYLGYSKVDVPTSSVYTGSLAVISNTHPANGIFMNMTCLSEVKNDFYSLRSDELMLNPEAANAFNELMTDYNAETGNSNIVVYNTTETCKDEDSLYEKEFIEAISGYSLDLAVMASGDYFIDYDGNDTESWVVDNCAKYGFVVRYEQGKEASTGCEACVYHLRYVGKVHSAIMAEKDFSLEEYIDFLRMYMIDTQRFTYNLDGADYEIYYSPADTLSDMTSVRVPVAGNYTISGNNYDGFIITARK